MEYIIEEKRTVDAYWTYRVQAENEQEALKLVIEQEESENVKLMSYETFDNEFYRDSLFSIIIQ
jgi:hypothetical protein